MKPETNGRRVDLRRWTKCAGRKNQETFNAGAMLNEDGQQSVITRARARRHAIRDLALQHHGRIGERVAAAGQVDELEQDWRRDVVRKVPGDPYRVPGSGFRVPRSWFVHFEEIAFDDRDVGRDGLPQAGGEIAIDFVRDHGPRACGERTRQRAAARADLDERLVRAWIDEAHDLV